MKQIEWVLPPASGGQFNQNDEQSGILMRKFARSQESVETRARYSQEIILRGSFLLLHILGI